MIQQIGWKGINSKMSVSTQIRHCSFARSLTFEPELLLSLASMWSLLLECSSTGSGCCQASPRLNIVGVRLNLHCVGVWKTCTRQECSMIWILYDIYVSVEKLSLVSQHWNYHFGIRHCPPDLCQHPYCWMALLKIKVQFFLNFLMGHIAGNGNACNRDELEDNNCINQ